MTKENGYATWENHPRWNELCSLVNQQKELKRKSENLRELIAKEVFGVEEDKDD